MTKDKVLCAIIPEAVFEDINEEDLWMDLEDYSLKTKNFYYKIIPLIDHPHSDIENGQREIHYHADMRYNGEQPSLGKYKIQVDSTRPIKGQFETRYFNLIRYSENHSGGTSVEHIKNSKLKHKCIHKGKCPHRGFDLSNINPIDGVITCPLHSLKFDAKTKKLIE
jgi:hypothetical protein